MGKNHEHFFSQYNGNYSVQSDNQVNLHAYRYQKNGDKPFSRSRCFPRSVFWLGLILLSYENGGATIKRGSVEVIQP